MSDVESENANEGWADAMAKVLKKQPSNATESTILAKAKTIEDANEEDEKERKARRKRVNKKRKWENMCRVIPTKEDEVYEKELRKVATKGVIQLFNAIAKHQKEVHGKLAKAKTEGKKEKVMKSVDKGKFLDMLNDGSTSKGKKEAKKEESKEAPAWSVLRDDFMMGNDMKDWDKQSDEEAEKME
uniref:RRP15-like protein n=1 Tax=Phallusia mammillata TaxID=59560 RepID=A0A6F9DQS0_9ASCI|nr:RRP15-like protein [Phallusia mammillata]